MKKTIYRNRQENSAIFSRCEVHYVDTRKELLEKINLIKNDNQLYEKCLKEQAEWYEPYYV